MRTLTISFVFATSLFAACTASGGSNETLGEDELGGETAADGEAAKADGQDNFGFIEIRKIGAFECNGVGSCTHLELDRANRSTMTCADGTSHATCEARTLDLSKLAVSAAKKTAVMAALQVQAGDPAMGTQVLARGKFIHGVNPTAPGVDWVTFQPTEVWTARIADASADGTFVRVADNGRHCITAPCATTHEGRLNSVLGMDTHGLDWSAELAVANTSPTWLPNLVATASLTSDGAIVAGFRTHGTMAGQATTMRSTEQVYLRIK